ncbi:Alpha-1,3-mannosyl-glycoprotein 2-beta-N-acetylglucosaminyltransferase [Bulinus truncatus]|nr:Alpha-1,3-mannosyl-glycoprotein 2-beta-N-acetylglucosaminyltransferase [Bulinus truncatus]
MFFCCGISSLTTPLSVSQRMLTKKKELNDKLLALEKEMGKQLAENKKLLENLKLLKDLKDKSIYHNLPVTYPAGSKEGILPILMIACDRVTVNRALDQLLKYVSAICPQISHHRQPDCGHAQTAEVIQKYVVSHNVTHIKQPDLSDIVLGNPQKKFLGYYKIARHYKWALDQVFITFNYSAVIIVEDDLDISPDFYEYFSATYPILKEDPLLWCVSAWNDNGKDGMVSTEADLLYRTDFFPDSGMTGYATLLSRGKAENVYALKFVEPALLAKRGSKGLYYDKHLRFIKLNTEFVPFTKWISPTFPRETMMKCLSRKCISAPLLTGQQVKNGVQPMDKVVRVEYTDKDSFKKLAKLLGIMDDFKAGVPSSLQRCGQFYAERQEEFLAPPLVGVVNTTQAGADPDICVDLVHILSNVSSFFSSIYDVPVRNERSYLSGHPLKPKSVWDDLGILNYTVIGRSGMVEAQEGENITFSCLIESNPQSNVSIVISNSTHGMENKSITSTFSSSMQNIFELRSEIRRATCLDTNNYTCVAENHVAKTNWNKSLQVFVQCSLHLSQDMQLRNVIGFVDNDVTVTVKIYGHPLPKVFQLLKGSNKTEVNPDDFRFHIVELNKPYLLVNLLIPNLREENFTSYSMGISNGIEPQLLWEFSIIHESTVKSEVNVIAIIIPSIITAISVAVVIIVIVRYLYLRRKISERYIDPPINEVPIEIEDAPIIPLEAAEEVELPDGNEEEVERNVEVHRENIGVREPYANHQAKVNSNNCAEEDLHFNVRNCSDNSHKQDEKRESCA